jgi:hypothetical protein
MTLSNTAEAFGEPIKLIQEHRHLTQPIGTELNYLIIPTLYFLKLVQELLKLEKVTISYVQLKLVTGILTLQSLIIILIL